MNPYTGDVPLAMGGTNYTLRFNWAALARVNVELGVNGRNMALAGDPKKLAALVAIGLAHHHPDCTADDVLKASPPYWPTANVVGEALTAAYWGPDGAPKDMAENPPKPPQTRLQRLCRRLFGQV